jgi:hypothetical protein
MSIPVATTTISVLRSDQDGTKDAIDLASSTWSPVFSGIRAVIGSPAGGETNAGGSSEQVAARLNCDPITLRHTDRVLDDPTGVLYEVTWTARRFGLGLDHTVADLILVTDRADA